MKKPVQKTLSPFIPIVIGMFSANVNAQIVYTDINPDTTVAANYSNYNLDLNNDGIVDFIISRDYYYLCSPYGSGATVNSIIIYPLKGNEVSNELNNYPKTINYNDVIGSGNTNWRKATNQILAEKTTPLITTHSGVCHVNGAPTYKGNWNNRANDKYLGLRLIICGNNYYGWVRLDVANRGANNTNYVTIKDYAFESNPNHSIYAGATKGPRITNPSANNFNPIFPSPVFQTYKTDAQSLQLLNATQKSKNKKHENEFIDEKKRHPLHFANNQNKNFKKDISDDKNERYSSSPCQPVKKLGFEGNRQTPFYLPPVGFYASECNMAISNAGKIVSVSNGWIYYFDETGALLFSDSLQHFCSGLIDVHVTYDSKHDRFVFCSHWGYSDPQTFEIYGFVTGFSKSNNPLDGWNFYYTAESVFNDDYFGDYPLLSISDDEAFVTYLRLDDDENIVSSAIVQMDKMAGYAGLASINTQIFNSPLSGTAGGDVVPAQGGSQTYGPNMYFVVANEGGPVSDLFYVQEVTNTIASGEAVLNTYGPVQSNKPYRPQGKSYQKYGLPLLNPYARTDDYVLSAFYENGILQFAQNTKLNGKASIYLGRISGIPNNLNCTAKSISDSKRYLSYPAIAYAGNSPGDNSAMVGYDYSAANEFPGMAAVYINSNFKISDPIDVKRGKDTINGVWGDYTGICRRYNHPGEIWVEGQYGSDVFPNINWIAKLHVPDCGNLKTDNEPMMEIVDEKELNDIHISPNPFSNSTTISITLPQQQKAMPAGRQVSIQIFDISGRLIKTLADAQMQAGTHQLTWNAKDEKGNVVSTGTYLLKMQTENYTETKKIFVVK